MWIPATLLDMIAQHRRIERAEMGKTFNMGVGMVDIVGFACALFGGSFFGHCE
ncbi:MAG: phosphoribosylaminoimidazole (AIR) synthetase [Rhodococcus sp. (in: high G+C Gram-positive bacteria)]|jgi:phosphoribosylaminoimidazole (AIR) synthetase